MNVKKINIENGFQNCVMHKFWTFYILNLFTLVQYMYIDTRLKCSTTMHVYTHTHINHHIYIYICIYILCKSDLLQYKAIVIRPYDSV